MDILPSYLLKCGKAKDLYTTPDPDALIMQFRDDISAFDGVKTDTLKSKGQINNMISSFLMRHLHECGLATHYLAIIDETQTLVRNMSMFPIECIVRNKAAGSFCKRYGTESGWPFRQPLLEWCVKDDALHDPMITKAGVIELFGIDQYDMSQMQNIAYRTTRELTQLFARAGLDLVDIKYEFGKFNDDILLGDELSPDSMRLWDLETGDNKDKDVYRHNLGDTIEVYREVMNRLGA